MIFYDCLGTLFILETKTEFFIKKIIDYLLIKKKLVVDMYYL